MKKGTKWIILGSFLILSIIFVLVISYIIFYSYSFISQGKTQWDETKEISLIIFCILMPILSGLFLWRGYKNLDSKQNKENSGQKLTPNKESFWSKTKNRLSDSWQVPIGLLICYATIWYVYPEGWNFIYEKTFFWINHLVVFIVLLVFKKNTGTEQEPVMKITGIGILILVSLFVVNIKSAVEYRPREKVSAPPHINWWKPVLLPQGEQAGKNLEDVRKFLKEHFSETEVEEMVIICRNESGGCNQFDSNGEVMTHLNTNGSKDFGVFQINDFWWQKDVDQEKSLGNNETEKFNIKTLEGNLKASLHLRKKYGLMPWALGSKKIREAKEIFIAQQDKWSEEIPFEGKKGALYFSGDVYTTDDNGVIREDGPGKDLVYKTKTMRFKSMGEKPVVIYFLQTN